MSLVIEIGTAPAAAQGAASISNARIFRGADFCTPTAVVGGNWSGGGAGVRIVLVYAKSTWKGRLQAHGGLGSWTN
jgi:hypothetical protein